MTEFSQPTPGDVTRNATVNLTANVSGYSQGMTQAQQQTATLGGQVEDLSRKIDGLAKRAGRTLIHVGVTGGASLTAALADAAALDKQLSTLRATSSVTGMSMRGLKSDVDGAFSKFPVARSEVVGLVQDISSLGVTGVRDIGSLTQTVIKLGAATGESMPALASGLIQLSRLMGNTNASQIGNFANSLLTVSKNAGVSATGVLSFAQAIAPIARQAGVGEAAVLGIATAFQKAGADGYYAANTLNSIIADITQLERIGSPSLAKYSQLVGQTPGQFRQAGVQQNVQDLFKAFGSGSPQVLNFIDQNYGVRAQRALTSVGQSGDMQKYIAQATASATNQGTLNSASKAAMNDLVDTTAKIRNQFTRLGDQIGGPLLSPINSLAKGFESILEMINRFVKALGPIPAILGVIGSTLSVVGGVALGHGALIGGAATARMALSGRTGMQRARREGREVGAAMREDPNLTEDEAMRLNMTGRQYARGDMLLRQRPFFALGRAEGASGRASLTQTPRARVGRWLASHVGDSTFGQSYLQARRGPHTMPAEGGIPTVEELGVGERGPVTLGRMSAGWAAHGLIGGSATYLNWQSRALKDSRLPDYARSAYAPGGRTQPAGEWASQTNDAIKARLAEAGIIKLTAEETKRLGGAMIKLQVEAVKAAGSLGGTALGAGIRKGTTAVLGEGRVGTAAVSAERAAGRGLGALGRGASALGGMASSFMFSPWGMAAMAALPIGQGLWHSFASKRDASNQSDVTSSLNPLAKYNDALGIATNNLASFSTGLKTATTATAGTASTATTVTGAQTVSGTDVAKYTGSKPADATVAALSKHSKNDVKAGAALLASYGMTDPKQLDLFKQNLLAAGWDPQKVQQVMNTYTPGAPASLAEMGAAINATEGHGSFATNASRSGNKLIGAAVTQIGTQFNTDLATHTAGYAQTKQVGSALELLRSQGAGAKSGSAQAALANTLATLTGGSQNTFAGIMNNGGATQFDQGAFAKMSDADKNKYMLSVMQQSSHGRTFLSTLPPDVKNADGTVDATRFGAYLKQAQNKPSDQQVAIGTQFGALGSFATNNAGVLAATGSQAGNPQAVQQAITALGAKASGAEDDYAGASGALMKLSDAMGGADTATGALIAQAVQWERTLQSFKLPTQTRVEQMGTALANVQQSRAAAQAPGATQQSVDQYKSDLSAYEQQKEGYRQYLLSVYQQAQQFGIQMKRAEEDNDTSIYRSKRNFYISMTQAQQDYEKTTARSRQDFAISEQRQAQSAAQSIYNPFLRVQAQYTTDAGTLEQNLEDQNRRIREQYQQLQQLRKMGVSQQSIDTLDLANPNNAQQLNNIVSSLAQNPQLIAQINKQAAARVTGTTALTQSSFSMTFRNTVADFTKATDRAAQDYDIAKNRALQSQKIALDDMAFDYKKMVKRSADDITLAMTEVTGTFGEMSAKTMGMVNKQLGKYAPEAAAIIDTQMQQLKTKYPALFSDDYLTQLNAAQSRAGISGSQARSQIPAFTVLDDGGISLGAALAVVSGNRVPEAHIPLNRRGEDFMAGMVARSMARGVVSAARDGHAGGTTTMTDDHSTSFTGPVSVQASDPGEMARKLKEKAKLDKLSRMGRGHGGGG